MLSRLGTNTRNNAQPVGRLGDGSIISSGAVAWWLSGGISAANCFAAYQAKGAESLAASKLNLNNSGTYTLVDGVFGAPTFGTDGWNFAGGNYTFGTAFAASTYDSTVIIRVSDADSYKCAIGRAGGSEWSIWPNAGGIRYQSGNLLTKAPALTVGTIAISGRKCYRNGAHEATLPDGTYSSFNLLVIGTHAGGGYYFGGKVQAVSFYSVALTDAQVLAVSTAMAAL